MSWDFSLESSKIKWVILAFLLLLVLVFLAGYVSGVLTNATVPDAGAKKTTPMTPKPKTTNTASVSTKADEKPKNEQPDTGAVVTKAGEGPAPASTPADAAPTEPMPPAGGADGGAMDASPKTGGDESAPMAGGNGAAPADETPAAGDAAPAPAQDSPETAGKPAGDPAASEQPQDAAAKEEPMAAAAAGEPAKADGAETAGGDAKPAADKKADGAEGENGKKSGNNGWTIQVGSFSLEMNAQDLKKKLKEKGMDVCILKLADHKDKWWYVVQVGEFKERAETKPVAEALKDERLVTIVKPITDTLMEQRTRCQ